MKITVIGAGAIGAAVAAELHGRDDVRLVQVCDARARSLQQLHDRVDDPRLRSFQVDVRDHSVLDSIVESSDVVVGCVPAGMHPDLARLCVDLQIHYCDLGGNDEAVRHELELAERARERSTWVVPNCGLAPGLVNILCLRGIQQFDEVEAAHLRVGDVPLEPEPPFNFRVTWSAEKVIDDYVNPVHLIEDGKVRSFESLSRDEHISFSPPFEKMEAFCTAGGLSTLTDDLAGRVRTLDHKTIRWPGHVNQMRFLLGLGFGEDRNIDVGTHLTYRDVLVRRLRQRLGGTCEDAVLLRVLVKGMKDGEPRTLVYEMVDYYDHENDVTAIERCTSIPAVAVAVLIGSGAVTGGGAAPPENVVPKERFCQMLNDHGLHIKTQWYDGYVDVDKPDRAAAVAE